MLLCATPASPIIDAPAGNFRRSISASSTIASSLTMSSCLVAIRDRLAELIHAHEPDCCALESVIYVQSHKTAITLGAARGSAIMAAAERGLPVFEYAPKRIKQATVGNGSADKSQVAFMVRALLGLTETPGRGCGRRARHRADSFARAGSGAARSARRLPGYEARRCETHWLGRICFRATRSRGRKKSFRRKRAQSGRAGRTAPPRTRPGLHHRPHARSIEPARRGASAASAGRDQPRRAGDLSRPGPTGRLFSPRPAPLRAGFASLSALDRGAPDRAARVITKSTPRPAPA